MTEPYKKVIRAIKRKMFQNGMNIRMTAEELGVHRASLGQYLNLLRVMPGDILIRAVYYFDIDVCAEIGVPHEVGS